MFAKLLANTTIELISRTICTSLTVKLFEQFYRIETRFFGKKGETIELEFVHSAEIRYIN